MSTATNLINKKATADREKRGRGGGGGSNVDLGVSVWGTALGGVLISVSVSRRSLRARLK